MKWVKLSTQFYNDPVFDDLTPNAERLFVRGLAFVGAAESEGILTQKQIKRLGILNPNRYVSELVLNQLWVQTETGDYRIRSWDEWQESPSDVEKRRENERLRQQKHRAMSRDKNRDVTPLDKTREEESTTPNGVVHTLNRPGGAEGADDTGAPSPPGQAAPELRLFDTFWQVYPRKVGKAKARTKYAAAVKRAGSEHVVVDGARRLADDPNLPPETRYIPHPTTWLERDGWDDEPLPDRGGRPQSPVQRNLSLVDAARRFDQRDRFDQAALDVGFEMRELG